MVPEELTLNFLDLPTAARPGNDQRSDFLFEPDHIPHQKASAVTISNSITQHRYVSQSDSLDNTSKFPNPQIRDLTGKSTPPDPLIRFEAKSTAKRSGIR